MNKKIEKRTRRQRRIRAKLSGTAARPRISVFRSNRSMRLQLIDDETGRTLAAAADTDPAKAGQDLAKKAQAAGIKEAVFDRGGYQYHGRVKKVADTLREGGIKI